MLRNTSIILTFFIVLFLVPQIASSQKQDTIGALDNLSGLKAYFDIKADSAAKVEKRLVWINDMYEQMSQKGLKASFIIGFRSQASFFVTREDEDIDEEEIPVKRKIEKWLKHFAVLGIPIEQCGLSAELYDIEPEDFLPEITVIKNGYISMIKYQNKGYAYIPM